jgi:hypothetical protein
LIRRAADVTPGDRIEVLLAEGKLISTVDETLSAINGTAERSDV